MGASSSVDSFGTSEAAAKEAERVNKVAYQQRAVNYARTHLFSESPMKVMPTREGGLTMTVDPARANEMLDQRRGRLGAPHLVSLTPAGDLIIQLFDDAPAEGGRRHSSFLDPNVPTTPQSLGGGSGRRPSSSSSSSRRRSSIRSSSGSISPNSPTSKVDRFPTSPTSPSRRTSSTTNSPTELLPPLQPSPQLSPSPSSPITLQRSPTSPPLASPSHSSKSRRRRVVRRWALAAPSYLPLAPPPPYLQDRSASHVTIAWDPPPNDGGLVERYEVEYRPSLADRLPPPLPPLPLATTRSAGGLPLDERQRHETNHKARRNAEAALVARNPTSYGWRALRTLHWYEWSYVGNGEGTTPARKSKAATSATVPQVSNAQPMQANEAKNHSDSVAAPHATTQDQNDAANADMSGLSDNKNSGATDTTAPAPALADPSGAASSSSSSSAIAPWGTATGMRADLRNLKPATVFEFRVRAGSHFGWSPFSTPSEPIASEPTPPDAPRCAPFAIYSAGDALWLNWPACQPNGAPVLAYELQWLCNDDVTSPMRRGSTPSSSPSGGGRSGGGSGWLEEQMPWESVEVSDNGYFLRRLIARSRYSARVRARNSVGWGPFSPIAGLQTTSATHDILRLGHASSSAAAALAGAASSAFGEYSHNDNDAFWYNSSGGSYDGGDYSNSSNRSRGWNSEAITPLTTTVDTAFSSSQGAGVGASNWAIEYERDEWWREHFDWQRGITFRSHCLTGERRNNAINNSRGTNNRSNANSSSLDDGMNDSPPDGVPGLSHVEVAELRFRFKRRVFQRALRRDIGLSAFSSSVSSGGSTSDQNIQHSNNTATAGVGAGATATGAPAFLAAPARRPSTAVGQQQQHDGSGKYLWVCTSRAHCCDAMLTRFASWDPQVLRKKRLKVQFEGEDGIDSGGLAKEFFALCAEALVSSSSSSSSNGTSSGDGGVAENRPNTASSNGGAYFQIDSRSSNSKNSSGGGARTASVARQKGTNSSTGHSRRGIQGGGSGGTLRGKGGKGGIGGIGRRSSSGSSHSIDAAAAAAAAAGAAAPPPSGAWRAVGRFLGKALVDRQLVPPLKFNHALLKRFLGRPVELADLAGIDDSLLASLTWVLHNSIEGVLFETFTVPASSSSSIGQSVTVNAEKANEEDLVELCPGGRHIDVTDANKAEYVDLRAKYALGSGCASNSSEHEEEALAAGLAEVVPTSLLAAFNASELERLFVGQSSVDVNELRAFAHFQGGLDPDNAVCLWLWEYWRALPPPKRGELLAFVTGSSRVPLDGFDPPLTLCLDTAAAPDEGEEGCCYNNDRGNGRRYRNATPGRRRRNHTPQRGPNDNGDSSRGDRAVAAAAAPLQTGASGVRMTAARRVWLPRAHTCFNQLVLPRAPTYDALAEGFEMALNEGGGFYLA